MKKLIKTYVVKRFTQLLPKKLIKSLYRMVVDGELQITTKVIGVKKGKIKYTLLVIKDRNLETVFNLGRHYD